MKKISIILILLLAGIAYGQDDVEQLKAKVKQLETTIETQQKTIRQAQKAVKKLRKQIAELKTENKRLVALYRKAKIETQIKPPSDNRIEEYGSTKEVLRTPAVTGRWQMFETTTIDGWVKWVKRGTIFKTTSGNIYEVVDVVILLEMELRPKVTVLTDGQFYKLLIKGVDEELLCKKISPGNKGTKDYINTGGGHWVSKNIEHGKYIRLEDRSLWEVNPIDKIDCMLWLPTSSITVIEGENPLYPYLLINTDDGEKVEAKLLSY